MNSLRFFAFSGKYPVFFIMFLVSCSINALSLGGEQQNENSCRITVDLGAALGSVIHRGSGILHSFHATEPPDDLVLPLKLSAFRGRANERYLFSDGFYNRLKKIGVKHIQVVLSDSYGYPNGFAGWPGERNDWGYWELVVENTVKECMKRSMNVEYDIWNEPDYAYFWAKDQAIWLETWKRGYRKIRSLDPSAPIVGPSITHFDMKFLDAFLRYAKNNDCVPDILSWHELGAACARNIPSHVRRINDYLTSETIAIKRFSINEIIPEAKKFSPGSAVCYLSTIERTPVESACRSCWEDIGTNSGENRSLDGMLTHDTKQPRSIWWAHKSFGDITGRIVKMTFEGGRKKFIHGLAGYDEKKKETHLVFGNCETKESIPVELMFVNLHKAKNLVHEGLFHGGRVYCVVEHIPPSGTGDLARPEITLEQTLSVGNHSLSISLPSLEPEGVYSISLSPGR